MAPDSHLVRPVRLRLTLAVLLLLGLSLVPACELLASPFSVKRATGRVDFVEKKRRMVLLPLLNMTGDAKLEYLREGIIKILSDRFKNAGFLWADRPETMLSVRPLPQSGRPPQRATRLELEVEAARLDQRTREVLALGDPQRRAELMESDYLLEGGYMPPARFARLRDRLAKTEREPLRFQNINGGGDDIVLEIAFFDARRGRGERRFYRLDRRRIYEGLDAVAEDLFGVFLGRPLVKFRVETPRPGAMAFIGDLYLGRTPLEYRLIPGRYRLAVRQPGFEPAEREIELGSGGARIFRVENVPEERTARLKVESDPPGALVYLDMEFLGRTPLDRSDLPAGAHRVRVSQKGHVDRFVGVELEPGEKRELNLKMRKGDTKAVYQDPHRVVLDWDYHELSFYSALNMAGFYAAYIHFTIRADRIDDSVVALVPTLSLLELDQLGYYHFQIINRKAAEAEVQRNYANGAVGGAAFSLVSAVFFLWRGIALDDREIGEIGFHFTERVEPAAVRARAATERAPGRQGREPVYQIGLDFYF